MHAYKPDPTLLKIAKNINNLIKVYEKQARIFGPYTGILSDVNNNVSLLLSVRLECFIAEIVVNYIRKKE